MKAEGVRQFRRSNSQADFGAQPAPIPVPTQREQADIDSATAQFDAIAHIAIDRLADEVERIVALISGFNYSNVAQLHSYDGLIDCLLEPDLCEPREGQPQELARFERSETVAFILRDCVKPAIERLQTHPRRERPFQQSLIDRMDRFSLQSSVEVHALARSLESRAASPDTASESVSFHIARYGNKDEERRDA